MNSLETSNEIKLDNVPTDCIQNVKFSKHSNQFLLAASWDGSVRLYDIFQNKLCSKYDHDAPVLDCTFQVSFFKILVTIVYLTFLFVRTIIMFIPVVLIQNFDYLM